MNYLQIVAALLVVTVAGQFPLQKEYTPLHKVNFRPHTTNDWAVKKLGHPLERSFIYGQNVEVPAYLRDEVYDVPVLSLEEVVSHPLFEQYYQLPYFRQNFKYPAFQRYVASVYFQRFWTVPAFQTYFVNGVYFYKYVYPLVNVFKYDTVTPVTGEDVWNTNVYPFNYYGQQYGHQYGQQYQQEYDNTYYRYIMDKIYSHIYQGQQHGRLQHIYTDVQLTPEGQVKEETIGQVVDPVTGEYKYTHGDLKTVEQHVAPVEHTVLPEDQYIYEREQEQYKKDYVPEYYQGYNGQYRHQYQYNPFFARYFPQRYNHVQGRVQYPFVYNRY